MNDTKQDTILQLLNRPFLTYQIIKYHSYILGKERSPVQTHVYRNKLYIGALLLILSVVLILHGVYIPKIFILLSALVQMLEIRDFSSM